MIHSTEGQQYELVGIASFRNACTTEALFTRVAPFSDWILETLRNPPPTPAPIVIPGSLPPTVPTTTQPDILGKSP